MAKAATPKNTQMFATTLPMNPAGSGPPAWLLTFALSSFPTFVPSTAEITIKSVGRHKALSLNSRPKLGDIRTDVSENVRDESVQY